jgi:class 3 adenylate cyclase/tetratricopeptide (TPR) repeat protein
MTTLTDWLSALGLERYAGRFEHERIDLDVLAELTEADLEALGVALGDRKRLLRAARAPSRAAAGGAAAAAPAPVVELRQVTILFVDLSGYTQLTTTLGAESTHKLVHRFYARVNDIVRSHSGAIERHIGDAVMAVFGLPVAHGNDPERALRAAQAIHEAMPALGAEFGRLISVHAGIASGQVVASRNAESADFATVGDAVNLAARLVNLADAGGTVLSDAVHRAAGALVAAEAIEQVNVKGFERPVRAWRVRGWRADHRERPALFGRDRELGQFEALCTASREHRRGALVLVRGEAGIGKTRLLEEFAAAAARLGFACHATLVLDFGAGRALDPIGRLVGSLLGVNAGADAAGRELALSAAEHSGLLGEDEWMSAADLLDLPLSEPMRVTYDAMDSAMRQRRRMQLVVELVRRASLVQPQLLMIEDVHWAAPQALETAAAVLRGIAEQPVAVVLTSRVQGDPTAGARGERFGEGLLCLTLDLQPLGEAQARALARSLAPLDETAVQEVVTRAGGNPLFLEQLLRNAAAGEEESLPGSIQSIVLARLDRLPARDRRALQAASVVGQVFSAPLLQHLLDEPGYRCDTLVREHLVREIGDEYLFAHALIREGTYLSLLTEQKRQWHVRAAEWFQQRDPMLTAEHLDHAQETRAPRAYLEAARAELAVHRPERALKALERGVAIVQAPDERTALLEALTQVLLAVGRPQDALAASESLLEQAGDPAHRFRARIGIAHALRLLDRSDEALRTLQVAEHDAGETLQEADRARIHYLRGSLYFPLGKVEAGLREQTAALEHARRAGSIELQLRALSGLGDAHYSGARLVSAFECFRECVELSRAHRMVQVEAANLPMLAICAYLVARIDEGFDHARAALALARRVADPRAELISHHAACILALETNDAEFALQHAHASVEIARAIGARRFVPEGMMFVGHGLSWQGKRREARAIMLEALELAREHISYLGPWILGGLASHAQDEAELDRFLQEGEAVLEDGSPAHNYIGFYTGAIEACLQRQRWEEALRYCASFEAAFRHEPAPLPDFEIAKGRALARLGRGERDGASRDALLGLIRQGRAARMLVSVSMLEAAARREGWLA